MVAHNLALRKVVCFILQQPYLQQHIQTTREIMIMRMGSNEYRRRYIKKRGIIWVKLFPAKKQSTDSIWLGASETDCEVMKKL